MNCLGSGKDRLPFILTVIWCHLVAESNNCIFWWIAHFYLFILPAVLVHCGVWPLQAEWHSEGLRRWTPVILWGACCECVLHAHTHTQMSDMFMFPRCPDTVTCPYSTRCLMSQSTSRSSLRRLRCSRIRTRPTSLFISCLRVLRMQSSSWGLSKSDI